MAERNNAADLNFFRLFCVTFVLSFSVFMTSLAAFQWMSGYADLPQLPTPPESQVPAPSDSSEKPRDPVFHEQRLLRVSLTQASVSA
jgi:hypothetical protein